MFNLENREQKIYHTDVLHYQTRKQKTRKGDDRNPDKAVKQRQKPGYEDTSRQNRLEVELLQRLS